MRKYFSIILALLLVFSLTACAEEEDFEPRRSAKRKTTPEKTTAYTGEAVTENPEYIADGITKEYFEELIIYKKLTSGAAPKFGNYDPDRIDDVQSFTNDQWVYSVYFSVSGKKCVTIQAYLGTDPIMTIPDTIDDAPVVSIASPAKPFSNNIGIEQITDIRVPAHFFGISSNCFDETAWYKSQPDGVVYLGNVAYSYKGTAPDTVTLKDGTLGIAGYAFKDADMKTVIMPDSVIGIANGSFRYCRNLETVQLSKNLICINGAFAFEKCASLNALYLPESICLINDAAFEDSGITKFFYSGTAEQWKHIYYNEKDSFNVEFEQAWPY